MLIVCIYIIIHFRFLSFPAKDGNLNWAIPIGSSEQDVIKQMSQFFIP